MSTDPSSSDSAPGSGNICLMLGLPAFLIGMVALLVFISLGHQREDPGPGVLPEETEQANAALTPEAPPGADAAAGGLPEGIDQAQWDLGKANFMLCAACHGPDGTGLKVGPVPMAPSLVGSETLLGEPNRPILVVLKGIQKETADFMGAMAPLGTLSDDQIAGVLTYVRNNWGNAAAPITADQVATVRTKFADVNAPAGVKRAEIDAILEAHK